MQYYAQRYMTQINDLFATIPSSLLLLLKTNDCLRQLDKSVGRPVNTLTGIYPVPLSTLSHRVNLSSSRPGNNLRSDF